ncbi:MAG: hypothetical protein KIT84_37700 [Labilithrix sp.]|nr:hypothetical protein [Labilithrix sp.]MCW5816793.1 hypothetical protein [Labilithrix sp.]
MRAPALLVLALLGLPGCYSKVTGHDGKFTIAYMSSVQIEDFVKPIAPGAKLDVHAFANGGADDDDDKLTIRSATSSAPGVLAIDKVRGKTLTLRGVAPGVAEVTIVARGPDGAELRDSMFFHVAKPARHALEHACTDDREAIYLRGGNVDVFHDLTTADGRPVIGYGVVPVAVEPAGALELVTQPQAGRLYRYRGKGARGQVTVRSTVDDSKLTLRIVEPRDLKEAELFAPARMLVSQETYVWARLRDGATAVCNQTALTRARSLTPEVCAVSARLDSLADENRSQLATVTARRFGTCRVELTLPELAGGKGVVLTREIQIGKVEYPNDDADARSRWPLYAWFGALQALAIGLVVKAFRARRQ